MKTTSRVTAKVAPVVDYLARHMPGAGRKNRTKSETEKADFDGSRMTLRLASKILDAAKRRAEQVKVPMNIAIVDEGGNLVAFVRMDGAWLGSIEIAQDKAWTARAFDTSTQDLGTMSQPKQPLFGIAETHRGRVIIFGGGIPIRSNGQVIGAIGVSGGTPDQDHDVAESGVRSLRKEGHQRKDTRTESQPRPSSQPS